MGLCMWARTLGAARAESYGEMAQLKLKLDQTLEGLEYQA